MGVDRMLKYYPVKKVPKFIYFFQNLVDFNEARLHEAILNPHTHS